MLKRTPLKRTPLKAKKTPIAKMSEKKKQSLEGRTILLYQMIDFFNKIWFKRKHVSEVSGTPIYGNMKSIYFHHILPKSKYKEAAYDEDNIILLTFEEHELVENKTYVFEEINKRRENLLEKYGN